MAGIGYVLAATLCFSVLDTTTKTVVPYVPLLMAVWARYVVQAVLSTAILWPAQGTALWRTANPRLQIVRGLMLLTSTLFAFSSLAFIPVGEFTAIVMITPLAITVVACTFLKEHVSPLRWLLVALGFAGAMLIIQPGGDGFSWAWLLPLVVVASNTWFQILTSKLAHTDSPSTTHFYTGWVATIVSTLVLPFVWVTIPEWSLWLRMLLMGCFGAIGHYWLTLAYSRAPATALTPFLYTQIGTSMLLGWLVFQHVPSHWGIIGMVIIAISGASSAWLSALEARILKSSR
ncbi:MAG: DMT family transporter [Betaproteobacteria bacterium]|jgi:drug/metabolite transporter (DMT)-like permease|nr:DMT family transporter [Betaproteobacteria bacterium]MBK7656648.1 DMT family transporter [Betaproteobacteria bacterium]MBP6645414.1 DMT family transporter [Burkholderiaceae bacterium]